MFTGIIDHCGKVTDIAHAQDCSRLWCESQFADLQLGESIALNGTCLTVTQLQDNRFCFDISPETMRLTNFKQVKPNDLINLERSLRPVDRMSGHFVSGHVDQISHVTTIQTYQEFLLLEFGGIAPVAKKLLVKKGSVAVNGVSLTINELTADGFQVMLIPHTLQRTNLSQLRLADQVNIEFDLLAKLVANQLQNQMA